MSKHTPGPWARSTLGFQVLTGDGRHSICEARDRRGQEEQVANAQLIAAAPDLLEACEAVDEFFVRHANSGLVQSEIDFLNKVRAAIAKATAE